MMMLMMVAPAQPSAGIYIGPRTRRTARDHYTCSLSTPKLSRSLHKTIVLSAQSSSPQ